MREGLIQGRIRVHRRCDTCMYVLDEAKMKESGKALNYSGRCGPVSVGYLGHARLTPAKESWRKNPEIGEGKIPLT